MVNRKILMSGFSIVSALALMGGSAFAAFTAQATNTGNTFGSGSLSLTVTPEGGTTSTPAFTVAGIAPGDVQTKAINLKNTGTVIAADTVLSSISVTNGTAPNLADKLMLEIWDDVDNSGNINAGDVLRGQAHVNDPAWSNISLGFGLNPNGEHQIVARVTFDSDADNSYQDTSTEFNLNFQANQ